MKLRTVGAMIATRALSLPGRQVIVEIGKPRKFRGSPDWYCPYRISGIGDEAVRYAAGIDAVQALELTLQQIGTHLYCSKEAQNGELSWDAGECKGDFGFPVPDIIKDVLPDGLRRKRAD